MISMESKIPVQHLVEILRIYSPSMHEENLSKYLAEKMSNNLGFNHVKIDKVNNVTGEIGSGSPTILLTGHMDTVPGDYPVHITKDSIYGRGACDAKSSLTSMLIAASELSNNPDIGKVIFAGVVDEEGNGLGTRTLIESDLNVDYAIFGEPSGIDNITIGYKGRIGLNLTCGAPSMHASAPWLSGNAIESIYEVWTNIKKYAQDHINSKPYNSVTASLTQIQGGSSHNTTPEKCNATIDLRIPPNLSASKIVEDIKRIIGEYQSDTDFPKLKLDINDVTEPFETDKSSPLIRSMIRAILKVRKKRPLLLRKTGTGDMNLIGNTMNIPVVTYGPGNPHLSHTRKEFVDIPDFINSIEVYKEAIKYLNK
jgi:LysW-gamma-L-lysine carboxypeptidase